MSEKTPEQELSEKLSAFETEQWAVESVFDVEIMTPYIVDPCCGFHHLSNEARRRGHTVKTIDVHLWDVNNPPDVINDWLLHFEDLSNATVLMNPPFPLSCEFVDHARMMNARKIIAFQRYAWREGSIDKGKMRGQWWEDNPPARIWLCGDRAQRLRFDLRDNPPKNGEVTAHAWFVWERGHRGVEATRAIYKRHRYHV